MIHLKRIDHIGVMVDDLETSVTFLNGVLGLTQTASLEREDLKAAFFKCGDASIELVELFDEQVRERRLGRGASARIEHIAVEIDDVDETLACLEAAGVRTQGPPRAAAQNTSIWTDPTTSGGIVYQMMKFTT